MTGKLVDAPGFPVDGGVLRHTRLSLVSPAGPIGEASTPAADGSFRVATAVPRGEIRLRIDTLLRFPSADRSLRRELSVDRLRIDVGEVPLPGAEDLGTLSGRVVDAYGAPLVPFAVEVEALEPAEAPRDSLSSDPFNAPVHYRREDRFAITFLPAGRYRIRARAFGRRIPPVEAFVTARERTVTLTESLLRGRLLGTVRNARDRAPLADVEISLALPEEVDWVRGRTSSSGAFDLPLPDVLPADGVSVTFSRRGFRGTDVRVAAGDLGREGVLRLHVELGPE